MKDIFYGEEFIFVLFIIIILIFKEPYYSDELSAEPIVVDTEAPDNKVYNFDPGQTMEEETLPVSAEYLQRKSFLIILWLHYFFSLQANKYICILDN